VHVHQPISLERFSHLISQVFPRGQSRACLRALPRVPDVLLHQDRGLWIWTAEAGSFRGGPM